MVVMEKTKNPKKGIKPKKGTPHTIQIVFRTDPGREVVEKVAVKERATLIKWDVSTNPACHEATIEAPDLMSAILLMASLCCEKGKVKDSIASAKATVAGEADGGPAILQCR